MQEKIRERKRREMMGFLKQARTRGFTHLVNNTEGLDLNLRVTGRHLGF